MNAEPPSQTASPPVAVLRYGRHPDQLADLRLPTSSGPAPLVIVVHGGFWRQAYDRAHAGPQSEGLAAAGYAVATIEYRRVGGAGGVPATFDDISTAVDAVPGLAAAAVPGRVEPARVVLVGHSAGGHLALWASARHLLPPSSAWHRARPGPLRGVLSLAGVCDLGAAVDDALGNGAAADLLDGTPTQVRDQLDPARLPASGVPTVLLHGRDDVEVPASYSADHAEHLLRGGTPVRLALLGGIGHYELIDPLSAAWPVVLDSVGQLVGGLSTLSDRAP